MQGAFACRAFSRGIFFLSNLDYIKLSVADVKTREER